MVSLVQLRAGQSGKVVSIEGGMGFQNKLNNLGVREGVVVKKQTGVFAQGPLVIRIGSTEVALGRGMASRVMVEPL